VLNLNDIVADVIGSPEHQKLIGFHPDVALEVACEPNLPNLEGSPIHLKKTILNLIANAAEAQPGGGRVRISTESRYVDQPLAGCEKLAKGEYILLRVADSGHGIAEEDLSRILSRLNYAVTTVSNGEKALAFLKENAVDLVILDMIMTPGMDGLDTYREIIVIRPEKRVIIASGYAETGRVKTASDMGGGQYLKKPYTLDKIGVAVRRELDRSIVKRV